MKEIGQWFATILMGGYMFVLYPLIALILYPFGLIVGFFKGFK